MFIALVRLGGLIVAAIVVVLGFGCMLLGFGAPRTNEGLKFALTGFVIVIAAVIAGVWILKTPFFAAF